MKYLILLTTLLLPLLGGCAHNHYNLPQEGLNNRLKVVGVAPIIVDADSDIRHPQREELLALLTTQNRIQERELIRLLKGSGSFYTVTLLDADPKALFGELLFRRERRDDAAIQYNKYFWKEASLKEVIRKNSLDGLLVVVVSGVTRPEKIRAANLVDSLETDYNYLIITAQLLDAQGTIVWEYPNFRKRVLSYDPLINLQYPDFDEAKANLNPRVQLKFKTMEGIKRTLEKRRLDLLRRETNEMESYQSHFEEIVSLLEINRDRSANGKQELPKVPANAPQAGAPAPKPDAAKERTP